MRVDFYHLSSTPIERVLPSIAERVTASGERLLVVGGAGQIGLLDRQLWTYAPESFLPHGRAGSANDAEQPVLIADTVAPANGARNVALADGQWRDEALGFDRAFYVFDAATLDGARAAWRALKDRADADRHFWKQDERGRWTEGP